MVTGKVPDNADGAEMIGLAHMQDLLNDVRRGSASRILGDRLNVDEARLTFLFVHCLSAIEAGSANAKIPAGFGHASGLFGMPQNAQLALNIAVFPVH